MTDNFSKFEDLPLGFACQSIIYPSKIRTIPFGPIVKSSRTEFMYTPVNAVMDAPFDLCQKYSDVNCTEYFCVGNNTTKHEYEVHNYCQYCVGAKDFESFHKLINSENNEDHTFETKICPNFVRFPSAFYCERVQKGFPLYYQDDSFAVLKNPFMCYCHSDNIYAYHCDYFLNVVGFETSKAILFLIVSVPLFLITFFGIIIPEIRKSFKVRERLFNMLSMLFIFTSSLCAISACIVTWVQGSFRSTGDIDGTGIVLSVNIFFIYFSEIPALMVFDRLTNFLNNGEQYNCPSFRRMLYFSMIANGICVLAIIANFVLRLYVNDLAVFILLVLSYGIYSIPWTINFTLFVRSSYRLKKALTEKTNISFFKTKVSEPCTYVTNIHSTFWSLY